MSDSESPALVSVTESPPWRDTLTELRKLLSERPFWFSLAFMTVGTWANQSSSVYLGETYGSSLPRLHDLLLDHVPYIPLSWLYDTLVVVPQVLLFVWVLTRRKFAMLPFYLVVFGIWQYLRAAFIILTPLGDPNGGSDPGLFASAPYHYGFYPSGHTSNTLFAYLFCSGAIARTILTILFILMAALIFGHAHYSIDIFSGVIFSYAIVKFSEKHFLPRLLPGTLSRRGGL
jgi:hypothetical protein